MYRKYYSYNDMPQPVYPVNNNSKQEIINKDKSDKKEKKFLANFENDDIILVAVLIMLFANDCDDKLLLLTIAFVFISGLNI